MGLKAVDITPISSLGPTTLTPVAKDVCTKVFAVSRTDTASTLKVVLPADASILNIVKTGNTNTDSATSSTVSLVVSNNSGAISTGTGYDVKTAGTTTGFVQMPGLPNLEPNPLNGDLKITATYAEVGASTTGGPWYFEVTYVR